jgi:hypothetical protein
MQDIRKYTKECDEVFRSLDWDKIKMKIFLSNVSVSV